MHMVWKARLGRLLERGVRCAVEEGRRESLVGGLLHCVSLLCLSTVGNPMVLWVLWRVRGGSHLLVSLDSLFSGSFFESLSPLRRNNFFCFALHPHNIRVKTTHVTPTRRIAVARIAMAAYRYTDPGGSAARPGRVGVEVGWGT